MSRFAALVQQDGPLAAALHVATSAVRRLRDGFVSRKLGTQSFRCGHAPRLIGLTHMRIGPNFRGGDHLWLHAIADHGGQTYTPLLSLGADMTCSDNVHIACLNRITIGDHALFGSRVIVSDHAHGIYAGPSQSPPDTPPNLRPLSSAGPIVIGRNVWLGDGVAVLAGASIGDGCVIGANSVVTGTIPPHTIAVGAPARPVRQWNVETATWQPIA